MEIVKNNIKRVYKVVGMTRSFIRDWTREPLGFQGCYVQVYCSYPEFHTSIPKQIDSVSAKFVYFNI